jgi:hypothetical protein
MSQVGVRTEIAELAIGRRCTGLKRVYNFDEAWKLRCEAFAKVSDHVGTLVRLAGAEDTIVAMPTR